MQTQPDPEPDLPSWDRPVDIPRIVPPEEMEGLPLSPFWSTLWKFARPYRLSLSIAALCAMVCGIVVPLQMQFSVKWIIDRALTTETAGGEPLAAAARLSGALRIVGLFVVLSIVRMAVWVVGYRRMLSSLEWILCRIRAHFFRHVQRMCFRFHDRISSGELFNYMMGSPVTSIKQFLQQFCMVVPYQVVGWFFSIGLLASFNWQMTVLTLAVVAMVVVLNHRSRAVIREVSTDFMKTESSASRFIADMLHGARAIKTYAMEDDVNTLFAHQVTRIRDSSYRLAVRQQIEHIKPEGVQYMGLGLILAAGAYYTVRGEMTAGTFTAFILSFNMLMQPILHLLQLNLVRANAEVGLDRIMRVMQVAESTPEPARARRTRMASRMAEGGPASSAIAFENVHFSYAGSTPVFRGVSCVIPNGQSVALVGPSGSGKTTFVSLMMRFYDVPRGCVRVNGIDVRDYGIRELRQQFAVVPQDPFVFQASLLDNLRVMNPEAGDTQIRQALDIACLGDFVDELPDGLSTWMGEGGSNLSGGQRQRLAIARAVLAHARYCVFDEATSALDPASERRIQVAMEQMMRGRTTMVIAHRLSTIRNVERILVFERGRIVQDGRYEDLARMPGVFAELLNASGFVGPA